MAANRAGEKMKKQNRNGVKVLWAVDAFHENPKKQLRALQSFLKLSGSAGTCVQPVSVLHSGSFDPVSATFPQNWHELASAALDNLINALENVANVVVSPIRLLKVDRPSLSASVDAFIQFAIEENTSLILVSSSARKGVERLVLGSFAETLVLRSPVPVLIVSPQAKTHQKITTLLYPTDFSTASKKGFDRVLTLARILGMQVLLFHKVRLPYTNRSIGVMLPPVSRDSLRELKSEFAETAGNWAKRGEHSGVRTKFHIEMEGGPPLDSILKASRRLGAKAMIAMTSQSGKWSATILGSLTRQVLRSAPCPVLVVHADQPSLAKKLVEEVRSAGYAYTAHPLIS